MAREAGVTISTTAGGKEPDDYDLIRAGVHPAQEPATVYESPQWREAVASVQVARAEQQAQRQQAWGPTPAPAAPPQAAVPPAVQRAEDVFQQAWTPPAPKVSETTLSRPLAEIQRPLQPIMKPYTPPAAAGSFDVMTEPTGGQFGPAAGRPSYMLPALPAEKVETWQDVAKELGRRAQTQVVNFAEELFTPLRAGYRPPETPKTYQEGLTA